MASHFDLSGKRVYVAGHRGMVGSAIVRRLARETCEVIVADRGALDLSRQAETEEFVARTKPDLLILAAARVGGIEANHKYPADFIVDNIAIASNVINAAHRAGVDKLLFLGSTCIYPRLASQPLREAALLTGPLEPTNEYYAIAKIAGVKLCQAYRRQFGRSYISVMPTNLYGPGDNYKSSSSHVVAALIRRFHEAKNANTPSVAVWGTGNPRREFLYVDDCADACLFILKHYDEEEVLNIGIGRDISIAGFAEIVARTVGYAGKIVFDASKPDGAPRKLVDVTRLSQLGWSATVDLESGMALAYRSFLESLNKPLGVASGDL